jgi:hypothetical protein
VPPADGPAAAVPLRFATGTFLAGVYPVAMGVLIGALTLGLRCRTWSTACGGWTGARSCPRPRQTAFAATAVLYRQPPLAARLRGGMGGGADSGVYSTPRSELAARRYLGTALTARTRRDSC